MAKIRFKMQLLKKEMHIWRAALDLPHPNIESLSQTLSSDERERADRYRFSDGRNCFIIRRGILRKILGRYLNAEPRTLRFCYGKNGKPALASEFGECHIYFNISHSLGIVLYAFSRDYEVGVDIEYIRNISEIDQISGNFFSEGENAIIRTLSGRNKMEAFLNCWTRKEAFVKATGDGLSCPLNSFEVSLVPYKPARLLKIKGFPNEALKWNLQELNTATGFVAAYATRNFNFKEKHYEYFE